MRELRNIIERALILARGQEVTERDIILPEPGRAPHPAAPDDAFFRLPAGPGDVPPTLEAAERAYVARVLEYCAGRRMAAAEALGISYPTLLKRLRELGLE